MIFKGFFFVALCFALTLGMPRCTDVREENFPEREILESVIAESIEVPFPQSDTLVHESYIGLCGNSSEEENNRWYKPNIIGKALEIKFAGKVLHTKDKLDTLMLRVCGNDSENLYDCFFRGKIQADIFCYAFSNDSIKLIERYKCDDNYWNIDKLFVFNKEEGTWKYGVQEKYSCHETDLVR